MKVELQDRKANTETHWTDNVVTCRLGDTAVEVRQSADGTCMVIGIVKGHVSIEPRSSEVRLVVTEPGKRTR